MSGQQHTSGAFNVFHWRLLPWVTLGLATPVLFYRVAWVLRRRDLKIVATVYLAGILFPVSPWLPLPHAYVDDPPLAVRVGVSVILFLLGGVHAWIAAPRLRQLVERQRPP